MKPLRKIGEKLALVSRSARSGARIGRPFEERARRFGAGRLELAQQPGQDVEALGQQVVADGQRGQQP